MTPRPRARVAAATLALAAAIGGCSDSPALSANAQRGRALYQAQCGACHNLSDPAAPGAVGPAIAGTPRLVLEAKLLRGTYPPGYTPKRTSRVMPPLPALAGEVGALSEYLGSR